MSKEDWHLDRKVTITMIVMVGGTFVTGILCYANLANDMANNKVAIAAVQKTLDNRAQFGLNYSDRVSKLETRVDYNEQALKDAIATMDKGFDRMYKKLDELSGGKRK